MNVKLTTQHKQMQVALEGVRTTSQPCHNFRALKAGHGTDDITTLNFLSQVNFMNELQPPKLIFLFTAAGLRGQLSSMDLGSYLNQPISLKGSLSVPCL